MGVKRWLRPAMVAGLALLVLLQAQSHFSAAEESLKARIGPVASTAVLLRDLPAGAQLRSAAVGYPMVPLRWRQPGAYSSPSELEGLVSTVQLKAGTSLGPGTTEREASQLAQALRPGERIVSTTAVAPGGSLQPGMAVEIMVTEPGKHTQVVARGAILVTSKEVKEASDIAGAAKVQAELRTGENVALKLASAAAAGAEVRLVPAPAER